MSIFTRSRNSKTKQQKNARQKAARAYAVKIRARSKNVLRSLFKRVEISPVGSYDISKSNNKSLVEGNTSINGFTASTKTTSAVMWADDGGRKMFINNVKAVNNITSPEIADNSDNLLAIISTIADGQDLNIKDDELVHGFPGQITFNLKSNPGLNKDNTAELVDHLLIKTNELNNAKLKAVNVRKEGNFISYTIENVAPQKVASENEPFRMLTQKTQTKDGETQAQAQARSLKEKWDTGEIDKTKLSDEVQENIELFLDEVQQTSRQWAEENYIPSATELIKLTNYFTLIENGEGEKVSQDLNKGEGAVEFDKFILNHREKLRSVEATIAQNKNNPDYIKELNKKTKEDKVKKVAASGAKNMAKGGLGLAVPFGGSIIALPSAVNQIRSNMAHIKKLRLIEKEAINQEDVDPRIKHVLEKIIGRKQKRNKQAVAGAIPVVSTLNLLRSATKSLYKKYKGEVTDRILMAEFLITEANNPLGNTNTEIPKLIILELVGKDKYAEVMATEKGFEILEKKMRTTV